MEFKWKYRYVPEGQIEPDENNRWAIDCYIESFVALDSLDRYLKDLHEQYIPIKIASINQKGTIPGIVPSLGHKFCCIIPSFDNAPNTGISNQACFYSNDIDELKKIVEQQFRQILDILKAAK